MTNDISQDKRWLRSAPTKELKTMSDKDRDIQKELARRNKRKKKYGTGN